MRFATTKPAPRRSRFRRFVLNALAGVASVGTVLLATQAAHAAFPEKTIRVVVGAPPAAPPTCLHVCSPKTWASSLGRR